MDKGVLADRGASVSPSICTGEPPGLLRKGIRQFNAGEYYACHETLERLWVEEQGGLRDLFQGLLQIAVACHHRQRGNLRGARSLLGKGLARLAPFGPVCLGIDLAALRRATESLQQSWPAGKDDRAPRRPVGLLKIMLVESETS